MTELEEVQEVEVEDVELMTDIHKKAKGEKVKG